MSKAGKPVRDFSVSEAAPRFFLFLKRSGRSRPLESPAKDNILMEVVMSIVLCITLSVIVMLVWHVLHNR
jgi:hypothetical protein